MRRAAIVAALAATLFAGACSKAPKTEADAAKPDPAAERAAATERAKQGPFGADVKALEDAKKLGADVNQKAEDEMKQVDQAK